MSDHLRQPSTRFVQVVSGAVARAARANDDAIIYMATHIPIWAFYDATPEQKAAVGCRGTCLMLGLWADQWPGYERSSHGIIWLFEKGISSVSSSIEEQVYETLVHEFGHALQYDHVLDAVQAQQRARLAARGKSYG